jgi:hypothetical protein
MPPLATSDEQPEQNFEIQRNDHATSTRAVQPLHLRAAFMKNRK